MVSDSASTCQRKGWKRPFASGLPLTSTSPNNTSVKRSSWSSRISFAKPGAFGSPRRKREPELNSQLVHCCPDLNGSLQGVELIREEASSSLRVCFGSGSRGSGSYSGDVLPSGRCSTPGCARRLATSILEAKVRSTKNAAIRSTRSGRDPGIGRESHGPHCLPSPPLNRDFGICHSSLLAWDFAVRVTMQPFNTTPLNGIVRARKQTGSC